MSGSVRKKVHFQWIPTIGREPSGAKAQALMRSTC